LTTPAATAPTLPSAPCSYQPWFTTRTRGDAPLEPGRPVRSDSLASESGGCVPRATITVTLAASSSAATTEPRSVGSGIVRVWSGTSTSTRCPVKPPANASSNAAAARDAVSVAPGPAVVPVTSTARSYAQPRGAANLSALTSVIAARRPRHLAL